MKEISVEKHFAKYVSQNVLGMIGMSAYILADTFFISKAVGANGITALNLVLPLYNLIFAIGAMIGVGSAIRFAIEKNQGNSKTTYFSNAVIFATIISIVFILVGALAPGKLVALLGGDETIVSVGADYTRVFMLFTPFFMYNHICNAFVRNDGSPSIAMAATLFSSLFNIVFDYVLMFPCKLGMVGAALATACSPIVGVLICCIHFFSKKNTICFKVVMPSVKKLFRSCRLGVSAFVGEFSSGVTTAAFNVIILGLVGNIGVAAYGVVANTALVAVSIFNGISQGSQPLLSEYYAKKQSSNLKKTLMLAIITAIITAGILILFINLFAYQTVGIFNSEHNEQLTGYAVTGLRLYFIGFIFAGFNIIGTGALSAVDSPVWAFIASIMRGFVMILACAFILSSLFGMTGVWVAFAVAEGITAIITACGLISQRKKKFEFQGD